MAIKLKNNEHNNSNKIIVNTIIIVTLLIASIGVCLSYHKIKKESDKFSYNIFESNTNFQERISESSYALYYKMKKEKDENLTPDSLFVKTWGEDLDEYEISNIKEYKKYFNDTINQWDKTLRLDLQNLDYYVLDKEDQSVIQKNKHNLDSLLDNQINSDTINKLRNKYRYYIVIDYDENGNMNIQRIYGADKINVYSTLEDTQSDFSENQFYYTDYMELNPIKNMTFVYGVPKELVYTDRISNYMMYEENYGIQRASYLYINIAVAFVFLVSLLIPYKEIKNIVGFKRFINIPLEIIFIIIAFGIAMAYGSSEIILFSSIKGNLINLQQIDLGKTAIEYLTYGVNIVYWFIAFTIISLSVISIKYILKSGIVKYLSENSLIYKLFRYIFKSIKSGYKRITNIDLKDKNISKIITILGINFIVLSIMCALWMFGIAISILYTIVLWLLINKRYSKINDDYNDLFNMTSKMANGNLDIDTNKDLGMFNSLKDEVKHIQTGFKKAVDEEVKSQKMKTELITNVSHDLKTPLTSIITYVDLLKDENLDPKKREEYLNILERKSQRLKDLIEDLFEMSKANSGNVSLNIMDVDVVSLMKQTLLELDDKINESSLKVKKNLPKERVILKLDSQRMFRVFENLIINITKYAMEGSRVYIDIIDRENEVEISFKNMARDEITFNVDEIAERFVRGDKSRNTEGSGLGLAIAKSFVELQGGKLNIKVDGDLFKVTILFDK